MLSLCTVEIRLIAAFQLSSWGGEKCESDSVGSLFPWREAKYSRALRSMAKVEPKASQCQTHAMYVECGFSHSHYLIAEAHPLNLAGVF